jgi:hypothetical protein
VQTPSFFDLALLTNAQNAYQPAVKSDQAHQRFVGAHEEGCADAPPKLLSSGQPLTLRREEALRNSMLQEQGPRVAQ